MSAPSESRDPWRYVPVGLRVAALWSAAIVLIAVVTYGAIVVLAQVRVVVWALAAALLLAAIFEPLAARLRARGAARLLSAAVVLIGFVAILLGALFFAGRAIASQFGALQGSLEGGLGKVRTGITDVLPVSSGQVDQVAGQVRDTVQGGGGDLFSSVVTAAGTASEVVTSAILGLFLLFFMLADGRSLWDWVVSVFPRSARPAVDAGGDRAWDAVTSYMRGIIVVALSDTSLIAIGLLILGVPLVVPLAALTFLGAFIPLVGATLAGLAAALVALVSNGPVTALIVVAVVLAVQAIDSHLLQPLIIGRAVGLHPIAVALAITSGGILAGVGGTIAATPLVAAVYAVILPYRTGGGGGDDDDATEPGAATAPG